jgi:PST family polysaccharide transporter
MLALLSALSVARPVGWVISAYLLARDKPRPDAALELLKLASLVVLLLTMGRAGPLWACAAVGVAFGLHALASMAVVQALDGVSVTSLVARCAPPLAACAPMVIAVLATRAALGTSPLYARGLGLAAEILLGALAYAASALLVARSASGDLVRLVRRALRWRLWRHAQSAPQAASASGNPMATSPGTTSSRIPS